MLVVPRASEARRLSASRYAEITLPTASAAPAAMAAIDPQRTGRSTARLPASTPRVVWSAPANATYGTSAVVAADGTIYVGTGDGVAALAPDGRQLWMSPLLGAATTPAITTDGDVAVTTLDGQLCIVSPAGTVRTRVALRGAPTSPPLRRPGMRTPLRTRAPSMLVLFAAPLPLADGAIVGGIPATGLHVLTPEGESSPLLAGAETSYAVPAMTLDGMLLVTSRRGGSVLAIRPDPEDPSPEHWRADVEETFGATLIATPDGGAAVMLADGHLVRLRPGGAVAWRTSFGVPAGGAAMAADGSYRVLLNGGALVSVAADGSERWRTTFGANAWIAPLLDADGVTLVADSDTPTLVAIDAAGHDRWRVHLGQAAGGRPVLGADGTIYLPDTGGVLHALR
ncbi:MAG: PQQ-like beta-propeller repeat protein [Deltaproteobacteria bacterium]|nr:PQQ-like beta-propeller repeat protein [Deltaproteobacteria bacterium]